MKTCSHCYTQNMEGMFYCDECGSPLEAEGMTTMAISTKQLNQVELSAKSTPSNWGTTVFRANMSVIVRLDDANKSFPLPEKEEVMFGRSDQRNQINPDIDLSEYGALEKGVSRNHAFIQRGEDKLMLVDMESVNGTYLNGQRVLSNQPRILRDGDEIRLGKFMMHIFFK